MIFRIFRPVFLLLAAAAMSACASLPVELPGQGPTTDVIADLEAADAAMARGDVAEAKRRYQALIEARPSLVSPHFQLGVIAYQDGQLGQAQTAFETVRARDGGHVLATHNLAVVHLEAARSLLAEHERLAPVSAARPALMRVRRAIEALSQEGALHEE